ncbi:hypothetical protein B0H11DRAFT_2402303 [Mycena galericulata]|nr:hypothetical protein B0H11DRAFT_2402303 [Mycena galericulata]
MNPIAGLSIADDRAFGTSLSARQDVDGLAYTSSSWIWTDAASGSTPRAFRKDISPPFGKSLVAADILISVFGGLSLYVNGAFLGDPASTTTPSAAVFCTDLLPSENVFAVEASTVDGFIGGLIATIMVTYSDGTTDTIVSDSSWLSFAPAPAGFEQPSFDDTEWLPATTIGSYGEAPWGELLLPQNPPAAFTTDAVWVWMDVIPAGAFTAAPPSQRAFRATFPPLPGQALGAGNIIVNAADAYTLYVNGVEVGSGFDQTQAQAYQVIFAPGVEEVLVAVLVTKVSTGDAGVLVSVALNMAPSGRSNCTAGLFYTATAAPWKSTTGAIPAGWQLPGFNDSAWPEAVLEGTWPMAPWGTPSLVAVSPPVDV